MYICMYVYIDLYIYYIYMYLEDSLFVFVCFLL